MWSTSFYFGNFLGPTLAGFAVESYGFRATTIVFFGLMCGILVVDFIELAYTVRITRRMSKQGYEELQ
jgi:MFS family permease